MTYSEGIPLVDFCSFRSCESLGRHETDDPALVLLALWDRGDHVGALGSDAASSLQIVRSQRSQRPYLSVNRRPRSKSFRSNWERGFSSLLTGLSGRAAPDGKRGRTVGDPVVQGLQKRAASDRAGHGNGFVDVGGSKSRGYCLEMICADFLAGASLENPDPSTLSNLVRRFFEFLPAGEKRELLGAMRECACNSAEASESEARTRFVPIPSPEGSLKRWLEMPAVWTRNCFGPLHRSFNLSGHTRRPV